MVKCVWCENEIIGLKNIAYAKISKKSFELAKEYFKGSMKVFICETCANIDKGGKK